MAMDKYWFLNDDQRLMQQAVREFVDREVRPRAEEIDASDEFPFDLWQRAAELGLTGIMVPEEYGGLGLDYTTEVIIEEEIGRVCPTLGLILSVNYYCGHDIMSYGTPEQKAKYLPDIATGRKLGGISSTEAPGSSNKAEWGVGAVLDGDDYVINVTKLFQTNVEYSNTVVMNLMAEKGPIKLIVDKDSTPGISVGQIEHKLGLHGSSTGVMDVVDARVPVENELIVEQTSPLAALARNDNVAMCLGILQEAFDKTLKYLTARTKNHKPLASFGAVGSELAHIAADIELMRNSVYMCARQLDEGNDPSFLCYTNKLWGPYTTVKDLSKLIELNGGVGYINDTGLGKMLRDAQGFCLTDGSTNLTNSIVQSMLGIEVDYI